GTISATQHARIHSSKTIENTGKIETKQGDIAVRSQKNIEQKGSIVSRQNGISLQAKDTIEQTGETVSKGDIAYQATQVKVKNGALIAAGVSVQDTAQGEMRWLNQQNLQGANVIISATEAMTSNAKHLASGTINVESRKVDLSGSQLSAHRVAIQSTQSLLNLNQATLYSEDRTSLSNPNEISTHQAHLNAGYFEVDTDKLNNQQGSWIQRGTETFSLNLKEGLDNTQGKMSVEGALSIQSPSIQNRQGVLWSNNRLSIDTNTGKIDSQLGYLFGKNNIDIHSAIFNNQQGEVLAEQVSLSGHQVNNEKGKIIAGNKANLSVNQLNNQHQGIVYSKGDLTLNTKNLLNQEGMISAASQAVLGAEYIDNRQGVLQGESNFIIKTASLNNEQGDISAKEAVISAAEINNTQGVMTAQNSLTLSGSHLDNRGGIVQAKQAEINLIDLDNRANGTSGSLLTASNRLALNVANINNQQTKASQSTPTQGIQAGEVIVNADHLDNQDGGIYVGRSANISVNQSLNNQQGEILSTGRVDITNPHFTLVVDNTLGLIESLSSIILQAKTLINEGSMKTKGDLNIALKESFTLNKALGVGNNLTFNTKGDFINNTQLVIGNRASIQGETIKNNSNAEISSSHTDIQGKKVDNFGLIDGDTTVIKADEVNNLGEARLYGTHLAIEADRLNNFENAEGQSATIAARERLDLGVGELVNRNHALIMSLGTLHIGGKLDENHQAIGYAKRVDNGSATIESLGNAWIRSYQLLNHDLHLKLGTKVEKEWIRELALGNDTHRYRDGVDGYYNVNNGSRSRYSYFQLNDGKRVAGEGWKDWRYTRTTTTTTIEYQDPAKILIGSELHLSGEDLKNKQSQILVGQKLLLDDKIFTERTNGWLSSTLSKLDNEDLIGNIDVTDKGEFVQERRIRRKRKKYYHYHNYSDFTDVHETKHFNFGLDLLIIGEKVSSTGKQVDNKSDFQGISVAQKTPLATELNVKSVNLENITSGVMKNQDNLGIKTHLPDISLPQASLYKINPKSGSFLIETDPRFTDRTKWLSSDYMFNALRSDPQNLLKRLGDGFYEQRLVNEQINQLTGRRFLENYHSDYEQYKALMDNGAYYAKKWNLLPGVALTAEQMKELTTDMVWMVKKDVTLKDGTKITVLAPQVYIVARNTDIDSRGALISANDVLINTKGDIQNSGVIAGRNLTHLSANNIENLGGSLQGRDLYLFAKNRLDNLGGVLKASENLVGSAKNINIESTLSETADNGRFKHRNIDKIASIQVGDEAHRGKVSLYAKESLTVKGANISVKGDADFQAGDKLNFGTVETENRQHYIKDSDNYYKLDQKNEVGNQFNLEGNSRFVGKSAVEMRGVSASSQGEMQVLSEGDIHIEESRQQEKLSEGRKWTKRGVLQSKTEIRRHIHTYDLAEGSSLDADNITLHSSYGNVNIQGANVVAENGLKIQGKNIDIKEAENRIYSEDFYSKKKSGLLSGGIGITLGRQKQTLESDQTKYYATASQVGSLKGDSTLIAENHYSQRASSLSSVKGDVNILAQQVNIQSAEDKYETNTKQTFEQKGLTLAITSPIISALQAVQSTVKSSEKVGKSKNDRVNAMAAANVAMDAYRAGQAVGQAGKAVQDALGEGGVDSVVGVQITYGQQKSVNQTHAEGKTAATSQVNAGGKVNIIATGAGKDSNIHIKGADVSGKGGTHLIADNDINITAAEQSHKERSTNKSAGFNAGVAIKVSNGVAAGVTLGGNYGKGYGNGDEKTYVASHVGDANSQTTVIAGGYANLIGSQLKGQKIQLDAQNLNIESLQDTATYKGKQMNMAGSVTVGYGVSVGGSYNQSKINAEHASVNEQAGIYAGDNGYDINVKNKVSLTGGAILSQAQKEKNQFTAQDFEYSNIQNYSNAKSSAMGLTGGVSFGRDQTSDEDKELNDIYRKGREGETFEQANPNKANESAVKFGLGTDDIHSTDLYALAKVGLTNLASNSKQSENRQSMTYSVISEGNFNIGSTEGKENIKSIKKSTKQESNKLEKVDYAKMQKDVEQDVGTIQGFAKNVAGFTDEAYRSQFIAEHRMMGYVTDKDGKPIKDKKILDEMEGEAKMQAKKEGISEDKLEKYITDYISLEVSKGKNIYQLYEVLDQQRNRLRKTGYIDPETEKYTEKVVVGFNGIFNQLQNAAKYATQNYVTDENNNRIYKNLYFIHNPEANGLLPELLVAGYQKYFEGNIGGLGNSTIQGKNLMEKYGKQGLFIGSHSRGTLTVTNALNNLEQNVDLSGTTMKMLGPATNVKNADRVFNKLSGSHILLDNDGNDGIGILIGWNPSTQTVNNQNYPLWKLAYDIFKSDASPHNCGGLGNKFCQDQGYRNPIYQNEYRLDNKLEMRKVIPINKFNDNE
ncbi:hemagglutinin repeat-containing protein, partial [Rodentibacter heidelbergensis]